MASAQNKYTGAAERAAAKTDKEFTQKSAHSDLIITNDPHLPKFLNEFYDGARYYKVDYKPQLVQLRKIIVIDGDYSFLGSLSADKSTIQINSILVEYPALFRVIFYNLMGQLYGLEVEKDSHNHDIMSGHWFIDSKHEKICSYRHKTHSQEKTFFQKLVKKHPLKMQL